jgi:hypothetical protein
VRDAARAISEGGKVSRKEAYAAAMEIRKLGN